MSASEDDDLIAAEYALGTLDGDERKAADDRRLGDRAFQTRIEAWELRLSPLSEFTGEAVPAETVWAGILRRIDERGHAAELPAGRGAQIIDLSRRVRRWKGATALVSALAACLAAALVVTGALREKQPGGPSLVAFLQKSGDAPAYLMQANLRDHKLAVKPVAAMAPSGRAYELWIIDPAIGAPRSLGVLDAALSARPLPPSIAPDILARATYAVTEEAPGGSATGTPTSQPLFVGHLVSSAF